MNNEKIIREFVAAWSRLDPGELASYFTEDGVYHNMPTAPVGGRENVQKMIAGFIATWTATQWDVLNLVSAGDVVIVDFWASWCVPCRRSFPWLNAMHQKYAAEGLVIIGVNLDADRSEAIKFLEEYPPEFEIYYDETKDLAREFGVVAMPSSYLIGRDGEIKSKHFGFKVKKQDDYESAIVNALVDALGATE